MPTGSSFYFPRSARILHGGADPNRRFHVAQDVGKWKRKAAQRPCHVAYKLRQGRDVERTTAATPMFSGLDIEPRAPLEPIKAARNGRASRRNGSDARTFRHTLNRGEKRQSQGVTADAHSYLCSKSTRGRYRHDSHRPCVVLAFRRMSK